MPHVFDEEQGKFVQRHYYDIPIRNSKSVHKRQRGTEYIKFLLQQERAAAAKKAAKASA